MSKQYPFYLWGEKKAAGKCLVCKTDFTKLEVYKDKKGRQHAKKHLTTLEAQVNWFRGDDEIIGVVCKQCKEGKTPQEIGKDI